MKPPRGYVPGTTPRSRARAPAAAIARRPAGLTGSAQPSSTQHQDMAGAHGCGPDHRAAGMSKPGMSKPGMAPVGKADARARRLAASRALPAS